MVQSHLSPLNIHANFVNWVANRHSLNTSSNPLTQCTTHPLFTVLPSQNSAIGNASSSFFPVLLSALAHVFVYSYSVSGRRSSDLPAAFYTNRLPPYVKRRGIAGYLTTLRHNDFLPSVSPRYDHSFGFSPRMTVFCISNSGNLQIILIFSTTICLCF
jgi:hypothetical protein